MRLDIEDIRRRVQKIEDEQQEYVAKARMWENMWRLQGAFDDTPAQALLDGREQVTLPTPYNIVLLAKRLISTTPKIEIPAGPTKKKADEVDTLKERWLRGFWRQVNIQQQRNVIADAVWQALVRGRFVFEVKWIKNELPESLRGRRLPILVRTLDPMNVGIRHGPLYTEYAYHKYRQDRLEVRQRYPKLKLDKKKVVQGKGLSWEDDEVEVVDFWYRSPRDGKVWNSILVEDEFAKRPMKTDYMEIPIYVGYGDSAPLEDEAMRGISILDAIKDLWPYQCRLASQMGTGLLWAFWPAITVQNEMNATIDDIVIEPGTTTTVPAGTRVDIHQVEPSTSLAQAMMGQLEALTQQSTFPEVMYGEAPGSIQAGYGVSILADAAKGRTRDTLFNLQAGLAHVNSHVLQLVETFSGDEGVTLWDKSEKSNRVFSITLTGDQIDGNYDNLVTLDPIVPEDDMQKQTLAIRLFESGIISKRTVRDNYLSLPSPEDEEARIQLETVLGSEEMAPRVMLNALIQFYPDTWRDVIKGTPFEELVEQIRQPERQEEIAEEEMQGPAPGAPPPGMMPPQGPLPPEIGPPSGPPPPGMMGPPPGPPPPSMMGPPPVQPPGIGNEMGIPPQMQGQLTPGEMGMPPDIPPEVWAMMMGQQLPPEEELNAIGGLPPEGAP